GQESGRAGLYARTEPIRMHESSEWRHPSSVEWPAAARAGQRSFAPTQFWRGSGECTRSRHRVQIAAINDRGHVSVSLTCLSARISFDQTHELAMILFQPAYEATRACGADVVLGGGRTPCAD